MYSQFMMHGQKNIKFIYYVRFLSCYVKLLVTVIICSIGIIW